MPVWLLLLEACWVAGFVGLGCRLWFLSIDMFDNMVPGTSRWKLMLLRRVPYPEQLNEKGQIFRRQYYRLLWIMAAHFGAGVLLFNFGKAVTR